MNAIVSRRAFNPVRFLLACLMLSVAQQAAAFVLLGHNTSYRNGDIQPGDFVYKWGDVLNLGSPGGTVTYSFLGSSVNCGDAASQSSTLSGRPFCATRDPLTEFGNDYLSIFDTAFKNWSSVADIDFLQVTDNGAPSGRDAPGAAGMIRIGVGTFDTSSEVAFSFIGPIRHESGLGADIFFNANYPWELDAPFLLDVAMHEIGHSLGLGHSFDGNSVMGAGAGSLHAVLTADDIAGVQTLYGSRQSVPEPSSLLLAFGALMALWSIRALAHKELK